MRLLHVIKYQWTKLRTDNLSQSWLEKWESAAKSGLLLVYYTFKSDINNTVCVVHSKQLKTELTTKAQQCVSERSEKYCLIKTKADRIHQILKVKWVLYLIYGAFNVLKCVCVYHSCVNVSLKASHASVTCTSGVKCLSDALNATYSCFVFAPNTHWSAYGGPEGSVQSNKHNKCKYTQHNRSVSRGH